MSILENRPHLLPVIHQLRLYGATTAKFASVLAGTSQSETLGQIKTNPAHLLGVRPKSAIRIQRSYALHMDNSGHFTGKGFGRHAHSDPRPLSPADIAEIPRIINSATANNTFLSGITRGNKRYLIIGETASRTTVIVEIARTKNIIDIVTAYNITKTALRRLRRSKQKSL